MRICTKIFSDDLRCKKVYFFTFLNVLINELKSFRILKICLMIKIKFSSKKFFVLFQSAQQFNGKREESASGSILVTNGSGCGSGRSIKLWIRNADFTDPH